MPFDTLPGRDAALPDAALAQLFTEARTRNAWSDRPVPDALIRKLYDLTKFGPTAVNATPARFLFLTSPEAKARLAPLMSEGNRAKTLQAPVNVIIGHDVDFHDTLPTLFPHAPGARDWFADAEARRSVRTLSGGETFQASLALALALSAELSTMSSTAARLDSIFLDEGFGSLDPDSLEVVAATLERLAQGDRLVGVVTHVQGLAERIPTRFTVARSSRTSTVVREG